MQGALEHCVVTVCLLDCCMSAQHGHMVAVAATPSVAVKVFQMSELQCQYTLRQHYGAITTMAVDEVCLWVCLRGCVGVCLRVGGCACVHVYTCAVAFTFH